VPSLIVVLALLVSGSAVALGAKGGHHPAVRTHFSKASWCGRGLDCRVLSGGLHSFKHPRARAGSSALRHRTMSLHGRRVSIKAHAAQATWPETTGGEAHTWTNYTNAGGYAGPVIPAFTTVQIACRLQGFRVADGNTWWYQIAQSPWNYSYYVSADAFYNNGQTSGTLKGTPFVDPNVPECGGGGGIPETAGGEAHTWTNYSNAGGTQGPTIGGGATVGIACKVTGFRVADGNTWWYRIAQSPWNNAYYVSADAFYNNGQTSGSLKGTPFVDPNVPNCSEPSGAPGYGETTGGEAHTWTNYSNAGGTQGPTIPGNATIQIECKVTGFRVADGNTWWYKIASSPWNGAYYVSADAFYNNGQTSGSLIGTPFVDPAVPNCAESGAPRPGGETTGGAANTWANYSHAGGSQGPTIPAFTTVSISCRVQGFAVADGNTWWYLVASSPWNNVYYVSADAFYNNGQTSGSLKGTPFVDPNVPVCVGNYEAPIGSAVGAYHAVGHATGCVAGDPVNCASGDFWQTFTDITVPGRGPDLTLARTYNAVNAETKGIFGYGWSSSLDQHLTITEDGTIVVTLDDGSQIPATPNGSGGFTMPASANDSLQQNGDGTYTLTEHATELLTFSATGKLLSIGDLNGYKVSLSYNEAGQLATVTDASGRSLTVTFGGNGDVASVTDPLGRITSYSYDAAGNLDSVTNAAGRTWVFTYDESHHLLKMTDSRGGTVNNTYDGQGRVTAQTDAAGLTTTFAYTGDNFSSLGGTTTVTDPHGSVTIEQYANGFLMQVTKAAGTPAQGTWSYEYDPNTFGTTSSTDPNGHTTKATYNATGQILTATDALGHTTSYTYNSLQEVLTATTPQGDTTTKTYDEKGNLLSVGTPSGAVTQLQYSDSAHPGDVTSIIDPEGRAEAITYDGYGDVASRTLTPTAGYSDTTEYIYDRDGELVCEASGVATAAGDKCAAAGETRLAGTATKSYDPAGEVTESIDAAGHATKYEYDGDGNQTRVTDPRGNVTISTFDADNRVLSKTAGAGSDSASTVSHAYDLAPGTGPCNATIGALYCTTTTEANGGVSVAYYNARNDEIASSRPGGAITHYGYDTAGNRTTMIDAAGATTSYSYDADNRETAISYSDGKTPDVEYGYDADGNRTSMKDGTGTSNYVYDSNGRLTSRTEGSGASTSYSYDEAGDLTQITYPNGKTVTRSYDGAHELVALKDWLGHTTTFSYDPNGNVTGVIYPNGDTVASTYSPTNALTKSAITSKGKTLASVAYQRNEDELISSETDKKLGPASVYSYDTQNRLTGAGLSTFEYDSAGNITGLAGSTQSYNAEAEVTQLTASKTSIAYGYDARGERTSATPSTGVSTHYAYDQAGRLVEVSRLPHTPVVKAVKPASGPAGGGNTVTVNGEGFSGATQVTFGGVPASKVVVSTGKRLSATAPAGTGIVDVQVTTPSGTSPLSTADHYTYTGTAAVRQSQASESVSPAVSYTYDGDGLRVGRTVGTSSTSLTWDTTPSVPEITSDGTNDYIYGPGGLPVEQIDSSEAPTYFFHDASGSTRALLGAGGAVVATFTYGPYGALKKATGSVRTPLGYGQGYTDEATGLIYLVHRYYDPASGQFMTVDPALSTTEAPYVYAGGDPVNLTDPSGACFWNCLLDVVEGAVSHISPVGGFVFGVGRTAYSCVFGSGHDCGESVVGLVVGTGIGVLAWPAAVTFGIIWDDNGQAGETNWHPPSQAHTPAARPAGPGVAASGGSVRQC
jgi:RHS repeat-associated protein